MDPRLADQSHRTLTGPFRTYKANPYATTFARSAAGWHYKDGTWYSPRCDENGRPISEDDWVSAGNPFPEEIEYHAWYKAAFHYDAVDEGFDPGALNPYPAWNYVHPI